MIELNNKEAHWEHLKHHLSHKLKASFLPRGEKEQITKTLGWDTCEALGKIKRSGYVPFALRLKPRVSADRNEVSCVVLCFVSFSKKGKDLPVWHRNKNPLLFLEASNCLEQTVFCEKLPEHMYLHNYNFSLSSFLLWCLKNTSILEVGCYCHWKCHRWGDRWQTRVWLNKGVQCLFAPQYFSVLLKGLGNTVHQSWSWPVPFIMGLI